MRSHVSTLIVAGCLAAGPCLAWEQRDDDEFRAEIAEVAAIVKDVLEETRKARNTTLNELFRKYVHRRAGSATAETVRRFNALLKERGLTNFDDFLTAQTTPLRYVKDPVSGDILPVFGPLGSDVINAWLAAMEIIEGKPLSEQPMYRLASDALSEHLDFALIGIKDPTLSLELLPAELREHARSAYQQLNPSGELDGGFDHPLFYATIREAARKLFGQDYPQAKLSMADLVLPEEQGGFGIRSCLLCHEGNHTDVYQRLLGQSLLLKAKATELRDIHRASSRSSPIDIFHDTNEIKRADAQTGMYLLAARRVLDAFPDKIDAQAAERSLASASRDNPSRFLPGYDDFQATLESIGCLECHGAGSDPPPEKNPAKYGAFVLERRDYYNRRNVAALLRVIDLEKLDASKLLEKAGGKMNHRGKDDVLLDEAGIEQLRNALQKWIHPFGS